MQNLILRIFFSVIPLLLFLVCSAPTAGAAEKNETQIHGVFDGLVAGTMIMPPFTFKKPNGDWNGLSVELLRLVANDLKVEFKVNEYASILQIKDALINGEIDLAPASVLSEEYEYIVDYTHPYYRSGSAIAVKNNGSGHNWYGIIDYFVSKQFIKLVFILFMLWLTAGTLVWTFEGRRGQKMFGDHMIKGLGHGIWWAAVTMTTVGYGDKAPETLGGRTVAVVWMLISIILISSFTATITTSLTVSELRSKVHGFDDLKKVPSGSMADSPVLDYLKENGVNAASFKNIQSGLKAVEKNDITAFVFEEPILRYYLNTGNFSELYLLSGTFNHHYVGMAVPSKSVRIEKLNRSILKVIKSDEWKRVLEKYFNP